MSRVIGSSIFCRWTQTKDDKWAVVGELFLSHAISGEKLRRCGILVLSMERLSEHDRAILEVIFDPLKLMGSNVVSSHRQRDKRAEEAANDDESEDSSRTDEDIELPEDVSRIVRRAIEASRNERYDESLRFFDEAIVKFPKSAALLNDRAQALRLVGRDDDALTDLNASLELSKGRGKSGVQALCQRGILHRCAGRLDEARDDFEAAACGGSKFARTQLVNLNPYAAMCNAMLRDINAHATHRLA